MTYSLNKDTFRIRFILAFLGVCYCVLTGCQTNSVIINDVEEREANEIVVFLASKDIRAAKMSSASTSPGGGSVSAPMFNIAVDGNKATEAMALLNQSGFPRKKGVSLLEIFAKSGLMSSEKEETIRYQAGLAEQIASTIRKIDGVIDADVQLSFPAQESTIAVPGQQAKAPITASVYVKHQGVLDDPNSHLVTKIKRLVAGSVNGLDINDVTVISDRSRYTDIALPPLAPESLTAPSRDFVRIWSIVMNKQSTARFRFLFFTITFAFVIFALLFGWMLWKFYPTLRKKGGWKQLFNPRPIDTTQGGSSEETGE